MARTTVAQRFLDCQQLAEKQWRQRLEQRLEQLLERARVAFEQPFERPTLVLNQRGTCAGSARLQSQLLRLNPVLLVAEPDVFVEQILPHELAHLLVHQLYGRVAPHGAEWQQMMESVFQVPARRTHQLDVSEVEGDKFLYRCGCQQHQLTIRRHNRVLRGASYRCRACGEVLQSLATESP
ncbi:SprT family zinc-dependent metalloprotease [Neiella sp. HB171785]|uniref:SprT family zinc-dependent metalloprotease n=1 Tax=Neiella litorisoli TaxID=2771431 RepID=A0A8J6QJS5_9GAMM|nr:SprT family zinc-dependent metalloprotease [Neiella litorisoli]MBD1390473.1 SprT family zinc-dependent metalloprotease [Neiella litorisoli]